MKCHYEGCKCKITITQMISNKCRCGHIYCNKHNLGSKHECEYEFKPSNKDEKIKDENLFIENNKCINHKIIKI